MEDNEEKDDYEDEGDSENDHEGGDEDDNEDGDDDDNDYEDGDDDDKGQPLIDGWVGGCVVILDGHHSTFPDFSTAIITQLRAIIMIESDRVAIIAQS